jgi:small subunit ribosomal protein S20
LANNKSSLKRIQINERNRLQNRYYKSSVRTLIKTFSKQIESYKTVQTIENKVEIQSTLNRIYSLIDKGCKKNIFHKNTAARKKAQLSNLFKNI